MEQVRAGAGPVCVRWSGSRRTRRAARHCRAMPAAQRHGADRLRQDADSRAPRSCRALAMDAFREQFFCPDQPLPVRRAEMFTSPVDVKRQHRHRRPIGSGLSALAPFGRFQDGHCNRSGTCPFEYARRQIHRVTTLHDLGRPPAWRCGFLLVCRCGFLFHDRISWIGLRERVRRRERKPTNRLEMKATTKSKNRILARFVAGPRLAINPR